MASSETDSPPAAVSEGAQQAPVTQVPAIAETRDRLLAAIGTEAQHVAEQSAGEASAALAELAHTYALVTGGIAALPGPAMHSCAGNGDHSISLVSHVPTNGFYVVPSDPDLAGKDQDLNVVSTSRSRAYGGTATSLAPEQLSVSMRINRAQDNAAGLAVSEKLRTQSRGALHVGGAIGFVREAEASLKVLTEVLQGVRVLAVQSAKYTTRESAEYVLPHRTEPDSVDLLTDMEIAQDAVFGSMRELLASYTAADVTDADTGAAVPLERTEAPWALRLRVGADADEALAVNIFAPNIGQYFTGQATAADRHASGTTLLADLRTQAGALRAIVNIDAAVLDLNHQRAHLSAFSNHLENALHSTPDLTVDLEVFAPDPAQDAVRPQVPAAAVAQDKLLAAISQEAQNVAEQFPGQASAQLAELAHAYASVRTGTPAITGRLGDAGALYPDLGECVGLDLTPEFLADHMPSAYETRDRLLTAIGAETRHLAEQFPGQASARLAELSRAHFLMSAPLFERHLPTLSQAWVDHNVSDPGVALLELAAQGVGELRSRSGSVTEPAVAKARDALLAAIGADARNLEKFSGQASAQLAELARAYTHLIPPLVGRVAIAGLTGLNADQNAGIKIVRGTQIAGPVPREVAEMWPKIAQSPAAAEARDRLLTAIGTEARNLEKYPGQASAQLAELARAYAHLGYPRTSGNRLLSVYPEVYIGPSLRWVPASKVNPEDIGTLSIEYREGQPVIVVSGGKAVPAGLTVVDGSGSVVTAYTAGHASQVAARGFMSHPPLEYRIPTTTRVYYAVDDWYLHQDEEA
ncbi:hypothetical protein ACFXB4_29315 [Streptomyces lavendulae]|uniref:flagellin N-terminal helical domain-containing protein n=1 Tax=Streptomyces lavendulae TaxID=1914 RepID=UPI0036954923